MKKYIIAIVVLVITVLAGLLTGYIKSAKEYRLLYERELQNVEAYRLDNADLEGEVRQYKMTVDDLLASKDKTDQKIKEVLDELKISYKKVEALEYQLSKASKTDTIKLKDTIFVNDFALDTLIGDNWYNLSLSMRYPSTIVTSPEFTSEKYVIIQRKKEFNKKPSKCFFIRWFQKKHWVTEVVVEEKNPYIDTKEQKFIKIEKK